VATAKSLGAAIDQVHRKALNSVTGGPFQRIGRAAGNAAKKAATDEAGKAVGGDRAMSGFRGGKVKLGAGYDVTGSTVNLNLRPAGVWKLADQGRRTVKPVRPKKRSGKQALKTPWGAKASAKGSRSRGLNVIRHTVAEAERKVPRAAFVALQRELRSQFRG
jgi:hypothetical protein